MSFPPPQPANNIATPSRSRTRPLNLFDSKGNKRTSAYGIGDSRYGGLRGSKGLDTGLELVGAALVWIVTVAVMAVLPSNFGASGVKVQEEPAGIPTQLKFTGPVKPLIGVN